MSVDKQLDLSEFQTGAEIKDNGGYEVPNWEPGKRTGTDSGARSQCQHCGRTVSKQFTRVFGDNDDVVRGCPDCRSYREMADGGIAGSKASEPEGDL